MHPAWLRCERAAISRYANPFAPCQTGASTPKNANLFLREPLNEALKKLQQLVAGGRVHSLLANKKIFYTTNKPANQCLN
jgi:hypothetical protein